MHTGLDNAVVMSSANGLVGTGLASRYQLILRGFFKGLMGRYTPTTPFLSQQPLTGLLLTYSPRQITQMITGVCAHDRRSECAR